MNWIIYNDPVFIPTCAPLLYYYYYYILRAAMEVVISAVVARLHYDVEILKRLPTMLSLASIRLLRFKPMPKRGSESDNII